MPTLAAELAHRQFRELTLRTDHLAEHEMRNLRVGHAVSLALLGRDPQLCFTGNTGRTVRRQVGFTTPAADPYQANAAAARPK